MDLSPFVLKLYSKFIIIFILKTRENLLRVLTEIHRWGSVALLHTHSVYREVYCDRSHSL